MRDQFVPVATDVFFDNSGTTMVSEDAESAIKELFAKVAGATGNVTPPFLFSRQGNLGLNSYLQVGNVFSNQAGQIIPGSNKIVALTITTSQAYNMNQTIQLQRRTGVSSFVDIPGAAITLPGNNTTFSGTIIFGSPINIGPNFELATYLKSGNGIQNAVLLVYVVPQ